jgi:SAM-dependent methyltransferase
MKNKIKNFLKEQYLKNLFTPSWYSIFINPYFIARYFLYKNLKEIVKKYNLSENKKILDVGCGVKPYKELFKNCEYIGIDIEGGGHKDEYKIVDLYFDGKNIPFENETFDVVLSTQVLEHTYDFDYLLKEMIRVLRKDGHLLITTPFVWNEHEIPFDFYRFTKFFYKNKIKDLNLKLIEIKPTCGFWATYGQLLSAFLAEQTKNILKNKILYLVVSFIFCFPIQIIFLLLNFIFLNNRWLILDYVALMKK